MLHEIQTDDFIDDADSESTILFQGVEEKKTQQGCPAGVGECTCYLHSQLVAFSRVEQAFLLVKYANCKDGPYSAEAMDFADVQGVVDLEPRDQSLCWDVYLAADHSDGGSSPQLYVVARGTHTHHACQHTVAKLVHVEMVTDLSLLN